MNLKFLHDSQMSKILSIAVSQLESRGIACKVTSPTTFSFSSPYDSASVSSILESCSLELEWKSSNIASGVEGTAKVVRIPRADESL